MSAFPASAATDPNLPHDSLVSHVLGICSAMLIFMTLIVAGRFWIRLKLVKGRLGADDWYILISWVLAAAYDLDPINQTRYGLGRHVYDLPPTTDFKKLLQWFYFGELLYYVCVAMTKLAILSLYLRLAVQSTYRKLVWASMAFVVLTCIACVVAAIFQCTPIHKVWDPTGTVPGTCINQNALPYANAGLDVFQDALTYVLPMRMLYQIQIPRRQKIGLMMIFAVGGFVIITGLIRIKYLKVAQNSPDPPYENYGAAVWSSIECNIGVVCACLPSYKAFIDRFWPSLMGHSRNASKFTPAEGSGLGKRSHMRRLSGGEFELEHGSGWQEAYMAKSGERNRNHNVKANNASFIANSSEEHLKGVGAHEGNSEIWKSTSVVVSHG